MAFKYGSTNRPAKTCMFELPPSVSAINEAADALHRLLSIWRRRGAAL